MAGELVKAPKVASTGLRWARARERITAARPIWPIVFLLVTMWCVRYFHSDEFGLYEDDFTHLPQAAQMGTGEALRFARDFVTSFSGQGHPFHQALIYILGNVSWGLDGLRGAYGLGFLLISLNVTLFYLLIRRYHGSELALATGLGYVLYSADTTQAFLTYSFGLQPSITLLIVAIHSYLGNRRVLAYALITLALFTYETTFLVFVAAPLLAVPWERGLARRIVGHGGLMVIILVGGVLLRSAIGERRVSELTIETILTVPLEHMAIGPAVALATYAYRPLQALTRLTPETAIVVLLSSAAFGLLAIRREVGVPPSVGDVNVTGGRRTRNKLLSRPVSSWRRLPLQTRSTIQLAGAGALMLILAYPLTFTVRPYAISGRDTRVHAAGVVGAALLVGIASRGALMRAESRGWGGAMRLALGLWLGLMAGYGFVIQKDYSTAWRLQREFWTQLVQLIPDVTSGTAVLVDPGSLVDTRQIGANYWNLPRVLGNLYEFPVAWEVPRVFRLVHGWERSLLNEEGRLVINAQTSLAPPATYGTYDPENTILIFTLGGHLQRISGAYALGSFEVWFRSSGEFGEPSYPRGFLYPFMIFNPSLRG